MGRAPVDHASVRLPGMLFLIIALAAGPAFGQRTGVPSSQQQDDDTTVEVGAGTTTETTTGSSGGSVSSASATGGPTEDAGASQPPPLSAALCDAYEDATVHKHCMDKLVD